MDIIQTLFVISSFLKSWITGSIFLNIWASLCYFGAFRKEFLLENNPFFAFGQGAREGNDVQNDDFADNNNQDDAGERPGFDRNLAPGVRNENTEFQKEQDRWQGDDGIIFQFSNTLVSIIVHKEWDKIDPDVLLHRCAYPVLRQLVIAFFTPSFVLLTWLILRTYILGYAFNSDVSVPIIGIVLEQGFFNKVLFQCSSIMTLIIQVSSASRESLKYWFDAVHKEAREDRYLVGEILLDYNPSGRKTLT